MAVAFDLRPDPDAPLIETTDCFDVRIVELAWHSSRISWIFGGASLGPHPRRREGFFAAMYRCERHYLMAIRLLGLRRMRGASVELDCAYELERLYLK